jgi:hypothetical protein
MFFMSISGSISRSVQVLSEGLFFKGREYSDVFSFDVLIIISFLTIDDYISHVGYSFH